MGGLTALVVIGLLGVFFGFAILAQAKSALHEIEAIVTIGFGLLVATVAYLGLVLMKALSMGEAQRTGFGKLLTRIIELIEKSAQRQAASGEGTARDPASPPAAATSGRIGRRMSDWPEKE